jgi:hypothetical protein
MTNQTGKPPAEIGVFSAASIGIGGMVGAGIFAVLGLAAATTKGAVPIAFVIGGVIALVTAHCYGKKQTRTWVIPKCTSSLVAGARYAQRCPVEFGVPMEVVIAA